ncbi:hypothetical protein HAALTHF_13760n [Vreelandella aquamarina]|nr:hypothetical protein HAALTHF_13760n [Halomonas axialensis]
MAMRLTVDHSGEGKLGIGAKAEVAEVVEAVGIIIIQEFGAVRALETGRKSVAAIPRWR